MKEDLRFIGRGIVYAIAVLLACAFIGLALGLAVRLFLWIGFA